MYLIPGLGYDSRVFKGITFKGLNPGYINWIDPLKNESIPNYSKRLFQDLPEDKDIVLIGHSFGGIVAQEIAAVKRVEKIILISSVKARNEIPWTFRVIKLLKLYKFFTKEVSVRTVKYWGSQHGFVSDEEKNLFKSMVGKCSNAYLQWALKALSGWYAPVLPEKTRIFQIHGTDDKTFPISRIKDADIVVKGGSHIMLYKQAQRISEIIDRELDKDLDFH